MNSEKKINHMNYTNQINEPEQREQQESGFFGIFEGLNRVLKNEVAAMDVYENFYPQIYEFMSGSATYDRAIYSEIASLGGKKSILEFACGTGRVLLNLAQEGHHVLGIDLSQDMLKLMKKKIQFLTPEVKERIRFFPGDMTDMQLSETFDIIILAATSICLLETGEQRKKFFENVVKHLKPGGFFIFDYQLLDPEKVSKKSDHVELVPINNLYPIHFMLMGEKVVLDKQYILVNFYNEIIREDGKTSRYLGKTRKMIISDRELEELIEESGLQIVKSLLIPSVGSFFCTGIRFLYCQLPG